MRIIDEVKKKKKESSHKVAALNIVMWDLGCLSVKLTLGLKNRILKKRVFCNFAGHDWQPNRPVLS